MMQPMMGPPKKATWKEFVEQLEIQIANTEKTLLLTKAQLKEAESHIKEE